MNKAKSFLAVASISLALAFIFSCSSDDSTPTTVECMVAGQCVQNVTADQCTASGGAIGCGTAGTVNCLIAGQCMPNYTAALCATSGGIAGCTPATGGTVNCLIAGQCMPNVATAQCTANGGTPGCTPASGGTVDCLIAGQCIPNVTTAQCTANGGTPGCTDPGPGGQVGSCAIPGALCIEDWDRSDCYEEDGEVFVPNGTCSLALYPYCMHYDFSCTPATAANKAACFAADGILASSVECDNDLPPSSSSRPNSSSSGTQNTEVVGFCDYGLPNTSGGGCFPIYSANDLGTCKPADGGSIVTRCGTSGIFCQWTTGCWETTSNSTCTGDYGTVLSECPPVDYGDTFYCLNLEASAGPTCTRIRAGGTYTGAKACINGVGAKAAVVTRDYCDDVNAIIVN